MDGSSSPEQRTAVARSMRKWDFWSARETMWGFYEQDTREVRQTAVSRLQLEEGDTVLDIGCGPGTNFELLRDAVGPTGCVVGVDVSRGMIQRASERVERHGWDNVQSVRGDAMSRCLGADRFDGALATTAVSATPAVRATVETVYDALEPGARFAVYDIRLVPSGLGRMLNPLIRRFYRAFGNWNDEADVLTELGRTFDELTVIDTYALGTNYLAVATKADKSESAPADGPLDSGASRSATERSEADDGQRDGKPEAA